MTPLNERVKRMEEMAELEEEYAVEYDKNVMGLGNIAIAGLIKGVALDSHKHAGLYRTIATILRGPLAVTDNEYDQLEDSLKRHIEVEAEMLEEVEALLADEEDNRVRLLLSEIQVDEERHHRFLSNLLEAVIRRDMIFEQDVWDMIWGDVPTHGAPRDPYA
jgi:hypothetical protein